jgi:hypothetical protein
VRTRAGDAPSRRRSPACGLSWRLALALLVATTAPTSGCAGDGASRAAAPHVGVGQFNRPPGMPIGVGTDAGIDARVANAPLVVDPLDPPPAEVLAATDSEPSPVAATTGPVPCAGCLELQVDVDDINQRDEFAFAANGVRVTRVVWTILVNFNSDQLAVQPFINDKRGKYAALHVNTFPLGKPVDVEQEFKGKAETVGLAVGSSGAWTGNQTMSVFIDAVRVEGPETFTKSFSNGDDGLAPRTQKYNGKTVIHPEK